MKLKFGQLTKYNVKIFFFKNQGEKEAGKLAPDFFLFFKEALYQVKASSPCAYQEVRNVPFFENLVCFVFLKDPF